MSGVVRTLFFSGDACAAGELAAVVEADGLWLSNEIVGTLQEAEQALSSGTYDLILIDSEGRDWTAADALASLTARAIDTPAIVISHSPEQNTAAIRCALRRHGTRLSRLYSAQRNLNQAIVRAVDRDSFLNSVCRIAVEDGGFRGAWIGLADGSGGELRPVARWGTDQNAGEYIERSAAAAAPGWTTKLQADGHLVWHDPEGSSAALPFAVDGRFAGALNLHAAGTDFFDEQTLQLVCEMTEDISFALETIEHDAERRRAEQESAELAVRERAALSAEARFRELIESAPDAILESDADGRILVANAAAEKLFGYTRPELLARCTRDLIPGGLSEAECAQRKDGTQVPVEVSINPVLMGGRDRTTWIVRDVTTRKHAEAAVLESNRRIANILESITDAFFALDRDWRFTYLNRRAEQLIGRRREDVEGRNIWQEFPALAGSVFEQEYRRAAAEQRPLEFTAFDPAQKVWAEVHVYPSGDGLSLYLQDITARKMLEEQGGQSQRLEALGRLAGGVAHDFNNLLTIIGGYGQMLLDSMDGRNPFRKDVEPIVEAATRASSLTRQLLAFSRRQVIQPKVLDLNRLITKMSRMLRRVIGEDIELMLTLPPGLGRIKADPGQTEQVIVNLAVNARDAMPTGGRLSITTGNCEFTEPGGPSGLPPGAYVSLRVSDSGTGMDEETRLHVFEPFFTTKARGKGTGLGLATVYGIVKQADGGIVVDSEPGRGSTFSVYFPRARKSGKRPQAAGPARRPRKGTETILLVEDDAEVRALTREMLTRLGYRVLDAEGPMQALSIWSTSHEPVQLLLTDLIMPDMNGRELARRLQADQPGLKVLYTSGYTDEVIERYGIAASESVLLAKPFSISTLGLKVRGILDGREQPTPTVAPAVPSRD